MNQYFQFNRMELAGSLGDFGTILPLALGMIIINGLDPLSLFFCAGVFYIFSGIYFRVTAPVESMKVIGAYAKIQHHCYIVLDLMVDFGPMKELTD
ncbi:MAG: putative sulfate/molybdate transporter [Deltaproteobacteria bacterium]|nr:putative sulfate/molybdate transporter [Deltaproteobacteria bacterium]